MGARRGLGAQAAWKRLRRGWHHVGSLGFLYLPPE